MQERKNTKYRLIGADLDVDVFLREYEGPMANERPLPSGVSWGKRPKWNGTIIDLTPVVGGPAVAPIA